MGSLYAQSIPVLVHKLQNLSAILAKGQAYAEERKMKEDYMLNFRLVHDMRPLIYQVQSCCNTAKFLPARLGVMQDKYVEDDEATFEDLFGRIKATIELLQSVDPRSLDGVEGKPVRMETKTMGNYQFSTGQSYVVDYAMPNFYFHVASAYCILRYLGVQIGALDFLGKDVFVKVD